MERRYGEPSKTGNDSGAEFNRGEEWKAIA